MDGQANPVRPLRRAPERWPVLHQLRCPARSPAAPTAAAAVVRRRPSTPPSGSTTVPDEPAYAAPTPRRPGAAEHARSAPAPAYADRRRRAAYATRSPRRLRGRYAGRAAPALAGLGLWIGAAAGAGPVLVLGGVPAADGGGGGDDAASATPTRSSRRPQPHRTTPTIVRPDVAASSHVGSDVRPDRRPTNVAGLPRRPRRPTHRRASTSRASPVTFVAANMVDGIIETCWRTPGDATGMVLTFRLDQPTQITRSG